MEEKKILRKIRIKARILNLSLQDEEPTVTYQPLSPSKYKDNYEDKWAVYEPKIIRIKELLDKAISEDILLNLLVYRILTKDDMFDYIANATIA